MGNRNILLVEDNPDDAELTLRAFAKHRVADRVVVVQDGSEALEYLFAEGRYASLSDNEPPDVVLLDLKLPKVDGLEVLRRVRAHRRTRLLPVVVITSSNDQRDIIESYGLGANSYVRKPVDFVQFSDTVRQLGVYWLLLNEAPGYAEPK